MNRKEATQLLSSVIAYFQKNYKVELRADNLKLNGNTHTHTQFHAKFKKEKDAIQEFVGEVEYAQLSKSIKDTKKFTTPDQVTEFVSDKVYDTIRKGLKDQARKKIVDSKDKEILQHSFNWVHHIPILDIRTKKQVMYDTQNKRVCHATSYSSWLEYLKTLGTKERAIAMSMALSGKVSYNPYQIEEVQYKSINGQAEILHVNAHVTPDWRKAPIEEPKMPKMFEQLMQHLFPREECQDYVYHWMNFMMTSRNHCYLFLHGAQGIGKNTLMMVMEKLVGMENYSYVEPTFWDDPKFNSELKHKRLVFFDETTVDRKSMGQLKIYTNRFIPITEKGIDTIQYENFSSMVIANNLDRKNLITLEDRRYSVPVLTEETIKSAFGQDWLDEFYQKVEEDNDFIANIGHWILKNGDTGAYDEKSQYVTEYFYDLVEKALAGWQVSLIELIEERKSFNILIQDASELISTSDDRKVGHVKITEFLKNYKDRDGDIFGHVIQSKEGRMIEISKKYWPPEQEEESNDDDNFEDLEF